MSRRDNVRRVQRNITDEYGIEVIPLTATYATDRGRRVMIMDGSEACSVEEYARRHFNRSGYSATRSTSRSRSGGGCAEAWAA